jgi:hypothetical protein
VKTHSHGLVTGYRSEDQRRYLMYPKADIRAGRCVSCRCEVFVNPSGAGALRDRDADPICANCDLREYEALNRSLIES